MKKVYSTGVDSASSAPTFWQKTKQFLFTTLNAMTFGIFGTIVVGAIVQRDKSVKFIFHGNI